MVVSPWLCVCMYLCCIGVRTLLVLCVGPGIISMSIVYTCTIA